jgi:hypothetical protein
MSEVKTNKITAATGTAITLGDSGDTFTVPSGATLTVASGGTLTNSGTASGFGKVLQVVTAEKTDTFSHNSATWVDVTDLSVTLTPASTSSKILLLSSISFGTNGTSGYVYFRFHSSAASGAVFIGDTDGSRARVSWGGAENTGAAIMGNAHLSYVDSPSTASAVTYKLQTYDQGGGTIVYVNRPYSDVNNASYTRGASSITALEIGA